MQQPIVKIKEVVPYSCRRVLAMAGHSKFANPPRWTFDFGKEISGHVRLRIPSGVPAATKFILSHGEVLSHPPLLIQNGSITTKQISEYDGSVYNGNLFWAKPVDIFTSSSTPSVVAGPQTYESAFTYHGFRYVELSISPTLPVSLQRQINISTLTGIQIRTNASVQSNVHIANPLLQKIYDNSLGTEASALIGIPNGAAGRGERAGWTGDAAAACESEMVNFDGAAFFTQYLDQIGDLACDADGTLSNCIPGSDPRRDTAEAFPNPDTCSGQTADASWSTVFPTVAYNLWKYFNSTGAVKKHYAKLQKYIFTVNASITDGLDKILCKWGDWNPVIRTNCNVTAAASFINDVIRMKELSIAIGETVSI